MLRFGIGLGHGPDGEKAAREALRAARRSVRRPDLTLAFGSIHLDQKAVHRVLAGEADGRRLLGGSSYKEVTNAGGDRRNGGGAVAGSRRRARAIFPGRRRRAAAHRSDVG